MHIEQAVLRAAAIGLVAGGLLVGGLSAAVGTQERCVTVSSTPAVAGGIGISKPEFLNMLGDGWIVDPDSNRGNLMCLHRHLVRLP